MIDDEGRYPPEVYELLEWFEANPDVDYREVPETLLPFRDYLKRDKLLENGTMHYYGELSGLGRIALSEYRGKLETKSGSPLPTTGTKYKEEKDVPAAFREGGKPDGAVLTVKYLENSPNWLLLGPYLTKRRGPEKELTNYVKIGKAYVYLYTQLLVLRDRKNANADKREE